MKVSMSVSIEASDQGKCFSSRMRYMEKAEISRSKMMTCPDIEDYLAPYKQPQMTWYKVGKHRNLPSAPRGGFLTLTSFGSPQECEQVEWRKSIIANNTHVWIPEVKEDDGGNYTCELQYGSRLVRRTLQLKVTGEKAASSMLDLFHLIFIEQYNINFIFTLSAVSVSLSQPSALMPSHQ